MDERPARYKLLLFGGTGAIGGAIADAALACSWDVVGITRTKVPLAGGASAKGVTWLQADPFAPDFPNSAVRSNGPYSAVCWAQGANANDDVYTVDLDRHWDLYKANCLYTLAALKGLLNQNLLERPARLCVISSIWQNLARQNKLSYCMTKAALQGLVLSASTDLAADGHLINAVLPGALDTPMTRLNLGQEQIERLRLATKFNKLPALSDVTSLVLYLCSRENTGITGQFIAADLGFSHVHLL